MSKSLPTALSLITDSWRLFASTWHESAKVSVWFLYIGLVKFALILLFEKYPQDKPITVALTVFLIVSAALVMYWASVRLLRVMLQLEAGQKPESTQEASKEPWRLFFPMLWVGILTVLISLGGFILFILPGIYLMTALSFGYLFLLEKGLRGFKAITASYALVKGMWWAVFWRNLASSLLFGGSINLLSAIFFLILTAIFGPDRLHPERIDPILKGAIWLFDSIMQAATVALFVGFYVKLYRAVERSKTDSV